MKKIISLMAMSVLLAGLLAACGINQEEKNDSAANGSDKKVLTMGTSGDFPPFEYVDPSKGEDIIGFDIDLAKTIAEKLGYEVEVEDYDFTGLIPALETKQVDFVLAGMTATEERRKNVDFSDIYYETKNVVVFDKNSNLKAIEDLQNKTVGVQLSSIQEDKAKELAKTMKLKVENRNRVPELIQEIKAGRFDAAIIEDTVAEGYLEKNKDLGSFQIVDKGEAGMAIAFPKGSDLTEKFNSELKKMKESGELEKLVLKWFE